MADDKNPVADQVPAKKISAPMAWAMWAARRKNQAAQANKEVVDGEQISPRTPLS